MISVRCMLVVLEIKKRAVWLWLFFDMLLNKDSLGYYNIFIIVLINTKKPSIAVMKDLLLCASIYQFVYFVKRNL